jgi:hypothetical protein
LLQLIEVGDLDLDLGGVGRARAGAADGCGDAAGGDDVLRVSEMRVLQPTGISRMKRWARVATPLRC